MMENIKREKEIAKKLDKLSRKFKDRKISVEDYLNKTIPLIEEVIPLMADKKAKRSVKLKLIALKNMRKMINIK